MAARRNVPRNVSDVSRSVEERDTFVTSVLGGAGRRSPVRWSGGGRDIFLDISRLHLGKWPFMMRYLSRTDGRTVDLPGLFSILLRVGLVLKPDTHLSAGFSVFTSMSHRRKVPCRLLSCGMADDGWIFEDVSRIKRWLAKNKRHFAVTIIFAACYFGKSFTYLEQCQLGFQISG